MTHATENADSSVDYYKATLEDGELVMVPHCACGEVLNEDYICQKCKRRCHCYRIFCDNQATLRLVQQYIRKSSKFSVYTATLESKT
jgi:hypothetical protein